MISVAKVFVAGGQPTYTYNPRESLGLENAIRNYLDSPYKVLSLTGPTKSGKTVLLRTILPREKAIWVSGGQINDVNAFWETILEKTGIFNFYSESQDRLSTQTAGREFDASAKVAGFGGGVKSQYSDSSQNSSTTSSSRTISACISALEYLTRSKTPLVVDDFHYLPSDLQTSLVRSLKDPVFEGVPVIFIAVPHRAYDVVRVEREMTGRVLQLEIPQWETDELEQIATVGFKTLNLFPVQNTLSKLVMESFASPHLMQDFCLQLCRDNKIVEKQDESRTVNEPQNWSAFFKDRASGTSKTAFERLAIGPRQRTDRIQRELINGETCDIYKAVLLAIAKAGPRAKMQYEEIRSVLKDVLTDQLPQAHEVSRVLDQMSRIAREEIEGEPVVYWDKDYSTLYISDPFFAYYLKWGTSLPSPIGST